MVESIDLFIKSDAGYLLGLALAVLGGSDLACGWYVSRHRPDLLPIPAEMRLRLMTMLFFAASFMLLSGVYMMSFHW